MKTIIFSIMLTLCIESLLAQNNDFTKIFVANIEFYKSYTTEQIYSNFGGSPTGTIISIEIPSAVVYEYVNNSKKDSFVFDDTKLLSFTLNSDRYALNDFLRVGDNISKLSQMGGVSTSSKYGSRVKYWKPATSNIVYSEISVMIHYNSQSIIISIDLIAPM